jgi:hypothetical protein
MRFAIAVGFVLVFAAGLAAQPLMLNLFAVQVVSTRGVFTLDRQLTPLQAHYILDEWNGEKVCSRVLYHENGQFVVSEMPLAFCETPR